MPSAQNVGKGKWIVAGVLAIIAIVAVVGGYSLLLNKGGTAPHEEVTVNPPPMYSGATYLDNTTVRGLSGSTYTSTATFEEVSDYYRTKMAEEGWTEVAEYSGSLLIIYEKGDKKAVILIDQKTEGGVLLTIAYGPKENYTPPPVENIGNTIGDIVPAGDSVPENVLKSGLIATDPTRLKINTSVLQHLQLQNYFPEIQIPNQVQLFVLITSGAEAETYLVIGLNTNITEYITAANVYGKQLDVSLESIPEVLKFVGQHIIIADRIEELQPTQTTADDIISSPSTYAFKRVVLPDTTYSLVSARLKHLEMIGHIGFGDVTDHFGDTDLNKYLMVIDPIQTETQIRVENVTGVVIYPTEGIREGVRKLFGDVFQFASQDIENILLRPVLYVENTEDDEAELHTIQELTSDMAKYHGQMVSVEGIAFGGIVSSEDIWAATGVLAPLSELPIQFSIKALVVADGTGIMPLVGLSSEEVGEVGQPIFGHYRFELSIFKFREGIVWPFLIKQEVVPLDPIAIVNQAQFGDRVSTTLHNYTVVNIPQITVPSTDISMKEINLLIPPIDNLGAPLIITRSAGLTNLMSLSDVVVDGYLLDAQILGIPSQYATYGPKVIVANENNIHWSAAVTLDHVTVTPSSASVQTGGTQTFSVKAYAADNTEITSGITYVWVANPLYGTLSSLTNTSTTFTATLLAGTTTVTVTATQGITIKTASATVTATSATLTLDHVTTTPSSASVQTGQTQTFSVKAYATDGTEITSGVTYAWVVTGLTGSTWSPLTGASTTLTAGLLAGTATVTVTATQITPPTVKTASATVTVTSGAPTLDHVTITPSSASVQTGGAQAFTAKAYAADGTEITSGVTYVWVVTGLTLSTWSPLTGASTTLTAGLLAGTATVTVTATQGTTIKTVSATVTVTSGAPASISIVSGNNQSAPRGSTLSPFIVVVKDSNNNPVPNVTVNWSKTIDPYGTWPNTPGSLSAASSVTDSNGQASSTLTLGSGTSIPGLDYTVTVSVSGYPLLFILFTATAT